MVSYVLRLASLFCAAAVLLSFAMFASDQAGKGSEETVARISSADATSGTAPGADDPPPAPVRPQMQVPRVRLNEASPSPRVERLRERQHGGFREKVDDVNDVLTSPFKGAAGGGSIWAQRIILGLLAFLAFGLGIGFLGRYAAARGV